VGPGEFGRGDVPGERGPHARDLVRRDLFAVAGPADHHAEAARVADRPRTHVQAVRGIVVLRVVRGRADVGDVVARVGEGLGEVLLELEPGVVGTEVNPHAAQSVSPPAPPGDRIKIRGS
jgi:hypothetical protein